MIDITILGTACMVPTKERNVSSTYAEIKGKGILFDCGEGTQRQMNIAGIKRGKVRYIFISHWHADHTSGLAGLIQTMGFDSDNPQLDVYGPTGTEKFFANLMSSSIFENKVNIKVHELNCPDVRTILKSDDFIVQAMNLDHGAPCLGFSLIEKDKRRMKTKDLKSLGVPEGHLWSDLQNGKDIFFNDKKLKSDDYTTRIRGKKLSYISDTLFNKKIIDLAEKSDIIISEATYEEKHEDRAESYFHMTSRQAAQIASMSNSKKLVLFHFSQRYDDLNSLLEEAGNIFPETILSYDLMRIPLK
ncbi:MAG: ribonuclease Z [Nanobdellota archaeon]